MTPVMPLFEGRLFVALPITVSVDRHQRLRSRHVGAGLQHDSDRFLGLSLVVLARSLSIGEGLADDILKVGVHVGMRAQPAANEKPSRSDNLIRSREFTKFARAVTNEMDTCCVGDRDWRWRLGFRGFLHAGCR